MAVDMAKNHRVEWAADKLLSASIPNLLTDNASQLLSQFAVEQSSASAFYRFAGDYVNLWLSQEPSSSLIRLASALIARDANSEEPFNWLKQVLSGEHNEKLYDHLLDALQGRHIVPDSKDKRSRLRTVANRIAEGVFGGTSELVVSEILVDELVRRVNIDHSFWDVTAAIEDSGLFAALADPGSIEDFSKLSLLKEIMSWVGTKIESGDQLGSDVETHNLSVATNPEARDRGGEWYRVQAEEPSMFGVTNIPEGIEMVFMDQDRSRVIARGSRHSNDKSFEVHLMPGHYALAVRVHETREPDSEIEVIMNVERAPHKLSIGESSQPVQISESTEFLYDSGSDSGRAWLAISLEKGTILQVETVASENTVKLARTRPDDILIMLGLMVSVPDSRRLPLIRMIRSIDLELYLDIRRLAERFDLEFRVLLNVARRVSP